MTDSRLFDLNLLVAFDALITERNVTRAASRVGVGQPAMSHALSRLRQLFGDELLVRTGGTMQPTTRALELASSVARVLAGIREDVLADRAFAPLETETTFRIGISDHFELVVLPAVLAALQAMAPKARVAVHSFRDSWSTMLKSGVIDLALGGSISRTGPPYRSEILFREEYVCLFDRRACKVSLPLSLKSYLQLPHIIMSHRGELSGTVDPLLARQGAKRQVVMTTPHFLAIPYLLQGFRAVAAVPRGLAERCRQMAGLTISPLPVAMNGFDVSMQWHVRTDTDPAHRWFRNLVREVALGREGGTARPTMRQRIDRE